MTTIIAALACRQKILVEYFIDAAVDVAEDLMRCVVLINVEATNGNDQPLFEIEISVRHETALGANGWKPIFAAQSATKIKMGLRPRSGDGFLGHKPIRS